jgi:hypothetical protein
MSIPPKGQICITNKPEKSKKLKKLVASSEELFQSSAEEIDYQRIIENLTEISDAKYAALTC